MRVLARHACGVIFSVVGATAVCGSSRQEKQTVPPSPQVQPAPSTPINEKKAELGETTWNPEWDKIVEQALPPSLLSAQVPRDVRHFCPRFFEMTDQDKRVFWAYFFQALAAAEAGLNPRASTPHTALKETEDLPDLGRTQGLLQLSYKDRERYGCNFDPEVDRGLKLHDLARTILQPANNLKCGVMILENQIIDQHKPLLTPSSYWGTLRPGTLGYRIFAKQMTNPPAACHLVTAKKTARSSPSAKTAD